MIQVDDYGEQGRPARQAEGEPGGPALRVDAHQEELPVTHDPGAEHDRHRELVKDRRGADPDNIDRRLSDHFTLESPYAVRYPSSHMIVWPVTSSAASLARKMAAPMAPAASQARPEHARLEDPGGDDVLWAALLVSGDP